MNKYPVYIVLLLTTACNLKCAYCYRKDGDSMRMPWQIIEKSLIAAAKSGKHFHVQLAGGEPLFEPELIKMTGDFILKNNLPASLGIQTNGTLVDTSLIKIFRDYNMQVGISFDGPVEIQEKLRGKSKLTLKGLKLLSDSDFPFQVTCVVTEHNADSLDQLALILGNFGSARGIGLDLLVCRGRAVKGRGVYPCSQKDLKTGIKKLVQTLIWVNKNRSHPLKLRELETLKRSFKQKKSSPFCYVLTGEAMAVNPDGTIYPCAQLMDDPVFAMGNINEPDTQHDEKYCSPENILKSCISENEQCRDCPISTFCPGECPARLYYNDDETGRLACVMYKTLWKEYQNHPEGGYLL